MGQEHRWSDDEKDQLLKLKANGLSNAEIAKILDLSRRQVAGKLCYLKSKQKGGAKGPSKKVPMLPPLPNKSEGLKFTGPDLTQVGCKWPVSSDDEPFQQCGEARELGKPYCLEHCIKAYTSYQPLKGQKEPQILEAAE